MSHSLWMKKADLYTSRLFQLLKRNDSNIGITSSFKVEDFLFPNANNKDKNEIRGYLHGENTRNILNRLIEIKRDLKLERGHINRYLQQMSVDKYQNYKRNPAKALKLEVRNIDTDGNLIKDDKPLPGVTVNGNSNTSNTYRALDKLIEDGYKTLSASNKTTYNKSGNANQIAGYTLKNLVRESINSQFFWKNTDLTQHALGSPNDLAALTIHALTQRDKPLSAAGRFPADLEFLHRIFLPHLSPTDHGAFRTRVGNIKGYQYQNQLPTVVDLNKNANIILRKPTEYTLLPNEIKVALIDAPGSDIKKEYLIIFIVDLFENVIRIYREILRIIKDLKKDDPLLHSSVEKAIASLTVFLNNTVKNYFNIDSLYTPYGFAKSRDKKAAPSESANKSGFIRVIGSMDTVKDTSKFEENYYPIQLNEVKAGEEYQIDVERTRRRFQEMFLGRQNKMKDAKTGETIYMGGLTMKTPIDTLSIKILSGAFGDKRKKKDRYIAVADKIIRAAENHLHLNDLLQIKNEIFTELDNVASYSNPSLRNTAFKTALDTIIRRYLKYREAELQDLVATNRFNALLKRYNITKPNNAKELKRILEMTQSEAESLTDEIMEAKEKLIVKLSYHQLMAIAYKVISLRIMALLHQERGEEGVPARYFSLLKAAFKKADQQILQKLGKVKRGNTSWMRNRLRASLNTPSIGIEDVGLILPATNRNRKRPNNINRLANLNIFGDLMVMENAEKEDFWRDLGERLRGYTIFLPYVDRGIVKGWGLFNLWEAASQGKISSSHYITDFSLTEKKYTNDIRPQGHIMVANREADLNRTKTWRAIDKKDLSSAKKLSAKDLRIYLYNLIFSEVVYIKRVKYTWSDDSKGKRNLVKYCRKLVSERRTCPILISREKVAGTF